jgi:hypothetical protein
MAKSERKSKWKKKFRAIKRIRMSEREKVTLKRITANIDTLVDPIGADVPKENPGMLIFFLILYHWPFFREL